MDAESFLDVIEEIIIPLFTGSQLDRTPLRSTRNQLDVVRKNNATILFKFPKDKAVRYRITRIQDFSDLDKDIVKYFIDEIDSFDSYIPFQYRRELYSLFLEKAIVKCLSASSAAQETMLKLIKELRIWAGRTYEGRDVTFGIEIDLGNKDNSGFDMIPVIHDDCFAMLSDGTDSKLVVDESGRLEKLEPCLETGDDSPKVPEAFVRFANSLDENNVGIVLSMNKEILLFKKGELLFAYRGGRWKQFNASTIVRRIVGERGRKAESLRESIYATCLDVSFARTGGSITHLKASKEMTLLKSKIIESSELTLGGDSVKAQVVRTIASGTLFQDIPRQTRQELVGIDGATIIGNEGGIFACGAIIKCDPGSSGGGRLASVKTLSKYGVSIKIAADGEIIGYLRTSHGPQPKLLFTFG